MFTYLNLLLLLSVLYYFNDILLGDYLNDNFLLGDYLNDILLGDYLYDILLDDYLNDIIFVVRILSNYFMLLR